MNNVYWENRWKNNHITWHLPQFHPLLITSLPYLNLKKNDPIFVPFCGASIDMFYLVQQGYTVIGNELSQIACEKFFNEQKLPYQITHHNSFVVYESNNITLYCGDFFNLTASCLSDIKAIYDRAALISLPNKLRQQYAQQLQLLFSKLPQMLLITITFENERTEPPYLVEEAELRKNLYKNHVVNKLEEFDNTPVCQDLRKRNFINPREIIYLIE